VAPNLIFETERMHGSDWDPDSGRFWPREVDALLRVENEFGVKLKRAPRGSSYDWGDEAGTTYDAVGNFSPQYFDEQWLQFQYQIERHLSKADIVPVDVSQFTPEQVVKVKQFLADKKFGPRVRIVGE
jgi:hypothetical protein